MGKRSRESQRRRRSYKKRLKCDHLVECLASEPIPSNSESDLYSTTNIDVQRTGSPGPRCISPPLTDSLDSAPSPLYPQDASSPKSLWEHPETAETPDQRNEQYFEIEHTPPSHPRDKYNSTLTVSLMNELNETEKFPVVVHENKRKLKVFITDPEVANFQGSDVLKLSMEEYVGRLHSKEQSSKIVIKCLRDRVESLEKEVIDVKQSSRTEKDTAVQEVRKFWRDYILEGSSYGGEMVNAALRKKRK